MAKAQSWQQHIDARIKYWERQLGWVRREVSNAPQPVGMRAPVLQQAAAVQGATAQEGAIIYTGAANSGSGTAYTVTTTQAGAGNTDKTLVLWTADAANSTATPTLAVNGQTARTLTTENFTTVPVGAIKVGGIYLCAYDGTNNFWQILSQIGA